MPIRKLKGSWWVDFQYNRRRVRKRSPVNTKSGAQAFEARLRNAVLKGEQIDIEEKPMPTYENFTKEWFENYVKNNNKPSEIRFKEIALRVHLVPFFGKYKINEISSKDIERFKAKELAAEPKIKNKSINNNLTTLAKSLRTAQEWYELDKLPIIKKLKVEPFAMDFLSVEDSEKLLNGASGIWHDIILVALKTGMRKGELTALHWDDINWQTGIISVKRSIYQGILQTTKSNRTRHIPMIKDVYGVLLSRKKQSGFIFTDEQGNHFNRWRFDDSLRRIWKKVGIKKVNWHMLRHTFASHLAMAGASMQSIQGLMGHSDICTTMGYSHLSPSTYRDAINMLETGNQDIKCQPSVNREEKFTEIMESIIPNVLDKPANIKQKQP